MLSLESNSDLQNMKFPVWAQPEKIVIRLFYQFEPRAVAAVIICI